MKSRKLLVKIRTYVW